MNVDTTILVRIGMVVVFETMRHEGLVIVKVGSSNLGDIGNNSMDIFKNINKILHGVYDHL